MWRKVAEVGFPREAQVQAVTGALQRAWWGLVAAMVGLWEFVCRICTPSERGPHFVLVRLAPPPPGRLMLPTPSTPAYTSSLSQNRCIKIKDLWD